MQAAKMIGQHCILVATRQQGTTIVSSALVKTTHEACLNDGWSNGACKVCAYANPS